MKTGLHMLEHLIDVRRVRVQFAGLELELREGENLAAELLAAGIAPFRKTPVSGAPRNPYCMMGTCFDCLVEIGGVTRQACMSEVSEGMIISRPAAGEADHA
ncbi:(2Fe-2S)-binding protein [Ciceribacter thiooxidans]|uniref:(2Fe-2S)-binding protein n=1 Tax=Ciceribacter thiooxidans TaxID=1969821 RepID=A0ABV7I7Z0_9HYPH